MDNNFIEVGKVDDKHTNQKYTVFYRPLVGTVAPHLLALLMRKDNKPLSSQNAKHKKHNKPDCYYVVEESVSLNDFISLPQSKRNECLIKGIVANTLLRSNDYISVCDNSTFDTLKKLFRPSNDPALLKFASYLEDAYASDIAIFNGCIKLTKSFALKKSDIPEDSTDDGFDQKIFAFVHAEFEENDKITQKIFLQITDRGHVTSIKHVELTWEMYHFSQFETVKKHFFIRRLTQ